jgi:hypothetical protein
MDSLMQLLAANYHTAASQLSHLYKTDALTRSNLAFETVSSRQANTRV